MVEFEDREAGGLATPVVLVVFNRPEHVAALIKALRPLRPKRVMIIADGPRPDRAGEDVRCLEARRAAVEGIDWDADVVTLFSEVNLGCRRRVSSGLDWVFSQVEEAIILEDDLVPHPDFFRYCEALLDRYRHDPLVGAISGDSFQGEGFDCGASYHFSVYPHCWGWATWRRAWRHYDHAMAGWPDWRDSGEMEEWLGSRDEAAYWTSVFEKVFAGAVDSWAFVWTYSLWKARLLTALPVKNLVSNDGFGPDATHTRDPESSFRALRTFPLPFPLSHPGVVERNIGADDHTRRTVFRIGASRVPPARDGLARSAPVNAGAARRWGRIRSSSIVRRLCAALRSCRETVKKED